MADIVKGVGNLIYSVVEIIQGVITTIFNTITGAIAAVWHTIIALISNVFNLAEGVLGLIIGNIVIIGIAFLAYVGYVQFIRGQQPGRVSNKKTI